MMRSEEKGEAQELEAPEGPLPDCASLRAAMIADGAPCAAWRTPHEEAATVAGARRRKGRPVDWVDISRFIYEAAGKRTRLLRTRDATPSTNAWFDEHASWIASYNEIMKRRLRANAEQARIEAEHRERLRMAEHEEKQREAARAALELKRKADVRRALADAARASSKMLGYCVLSFRDLDDVRPRWLYVLLGQDGTLYAGSGLNVRSRVRSHRAGTGAAVTRDRPQRWHLLFAERFEIGAATLCAEFALLHSVPMQETLLFQVAERARRMHARSGCAVPWLKLSAGGCRQRAGEAGRHGEQIGMRGQ